MQKKIQIIDPCKQDWNQMMDFNQNKFCTKCEKEVVDFTSYTTKQLVKKINGSNKVCGKITKTQLDADLRNNSGNKYLNKWALFIGLGTFIGFSNPVLANKSEHKTELREKTQWKSILPTKKINDSIKITGKVIDSDSLELPGTNVTYKGTEISTQTDFDGNFTLIIPTEKLMKKNLLVFSFVGYKTEEIEFNKTDESIKVQMNIDAELEQEVVILGGISYRQNIFDKVGYFFHNIFSGHKTCN